METIKIKDVNTGAIKEVKKSLASDYVGTGNFEIYTEKKEAIKQEVPKTSNFKFSMNNKEEK